MQLEQSDELTFLTNLKREYRELHYSIEDGFIKVWLDRNIEIDRFNKLNRKLLDRGYIYDKKTYKWMKTVG